MIVKTKENLKERICMFIKGIYKTKRYYCDMFLGVWHLTEPDKDFRIYNHVGYEVSIYQVTHSSSDPDVICYFEDNRASLCTKEMTWYLPGSGEYGFIGDDEVADLLYNYLIERLD